MDMRAKTLRCFVAVAEEQSFSRAAQRIHITQPSLSAQIHALELALGFELFIRSTRHVELTENGRSFLPSARNVLEAFASLERQANNLKQRSQSHIRIGAAFYTIAIPERIALIEGFIGAHPDIHVEIDTRFQSELMRDLLSGRVDVMLMIGVPVAPASFNRLVGKGAGAEILYPSNLRHLTLRIEPVRILVPEELPQAAFKTMGRKALQGLRVATLAREHGEPVTKPILDALIVAGAKPVVPPEGHGVGVERYGRQFRMPAITLGWFDNYPGEGKPMVRRELAGVDGTTELALVANPLHRTDAIEALWKFATHRF